MLLTASAWAPSDGKGVVAAFYNAGIKTGFFLMEFIRGVHNLRPRHRGCVAAFGGFDGLHAGHRAVIERAQAAAKAGTHPATVVLFEPLPREFFDAPNAPGRLYPLRERVSILAGLGVERVVCLKFNARLAAMRAETFVERILAGKLGVHTLVVGDGFRFGQAQTGDVSLLEAAATKHGFAVECVDAVTSDDGERISSTRVRAALKDADFESAEQLLGRAYRVSGRVKHGDKRGERLGFPTANLALGRRPPPLHGVFAVAVEGAAAETLPGVANAGRRPTFDGGGFCFEVHLPGFSDNLYRRRLHVRPLAKIRDERRFDTVEALKSRIKEDVEAAMELARL